MSGGERRTHLVPAEAKGQRLDAVLATSFPDLSRSRVQALIDEGRVQVDGRVVAKPSVRLRGGETLTIDVPAPKPAEPIAQELPLTVLYEDADLIVLDKAAGMVVHPAAGHTDGTLVNALLHRIRDLAGIGGELRPGIVHRLDKDTSGCMVVAKNEATLHALQAAFKGREVKKTYLALVHGVPTPEEGRIETPYGRHPVHRKKFSGRVKSGKPAMTHYRTLETFDKASLVEVDLETGRTHQVRVHFAERGHPLLCDALYGGARRATGAVAEAQKALGRHALHAWKLSFTHPATHQPLTFEAQLPEDFARALQALRATDQ
ncbi:MAG: RluA family pseudouridine synthase [Myxococcaceae bacterium]|nr:RluA family pseudouridine synthase [Myxococcaceae bacterium]